MVQLYEIVVSEDLSYGDSIHTELLGSWEAQDGTRTNAIIPNNSYWDTEPCENLSLYRVLAVNQGNQFCVYDCEIFNTRGTVIPQITFWI